TIATAPPSSTAAHLIWSSYLLPAALVWIAATFFAHDDEAQPGSASRSIAMVSAYGNVIMLGIPLAVAQFGQKAATTVAFIVLAHSPVLFLVAALHSQIADGLRFSPINGRTVATVPLGGVAIYRSRVIATSLVRATREVSIELATNPIIIAIIIG